MARKIYLIFILLAIVFIEIDCSRLSKIRIKDKWYIDEDNRVVLLHGINTVQKAFPWYPDNTGAVNDNCRDHCDMTNKTQLAYLKSWGLNVVRLGFMWTGLFPEKGVLNQTYVDKMVEIVNNLEDHGIYVIIDLHQDMLSSLFESYDAAPLWILNELPAPKQPYPWPFKKKGLFYGGAYFTEACSFAFECLYTNKSKFEGYFHEYWTTTAKIFKDMSSVLAYELINEPWAGDIYQNPFYFLPGVAGRINLMPFYDRVYEKIREIDEETIVMYEPVTWGIMSNTTIFGSGFDHAPGKDPNRTALAWHYYCWIINIDPNPIENDTLPTYIKGICDDWQLPLYFNTVINDLKRYGAAASFITEFGSCNFVNPDSGKINVEQCVLILDEADKYFVPWTYWASDFYDDNFHIIPDYINIFARVYPMATNGVPITLDYNSTTRYFNYTFDANMTTKAQASLKTEIFVPQVLYPNGFDVIVSDNLKWTYDSNMTRVLVSLKDTVLDHFESVIGNTFSSLSNIIIKSKSK